MRQKHIYLCVWWYDIHQSFASYKKYWSICARSIFFFIYQVNVSHFRSKSRYKRAATYLELTKFCYRDLVSNYLSSPSSHISVRLRARSLQNLSPQTRKATTTRPSSLKFAWLQSHKYLGTLYTIKQDKFSAKMRWLSSSWVQMNTRNSHCDWPRIHVSDNLRKPILNALLTLLHNILAKKQTTSKSCNGIHSSLQKNTVKLETHILAYFKHFC